MPVYFLLLEFLGGAFLANGVPHFVQGVSGSPFQSPFAKPPGIGESSPVSNVLWGFANLVAGAVLLHFFWPQGRTAAVGWIAVCAGALLLAVQLATHFGKVRASKPHSEKV
jgi:hypothetical protein